MYYELSIGGDLNFRDLVMKQRHEIKKLKEVMRVYTLSDYGNAINEVQERQKRRKVCITNICNNYKLKTL